MKPKALLLAATILSAPAFAQQAGKVSQMPFASTPLAGTELVYLVQNGISVKCTVTACGLGGGTPFDLTITDGTHVVANVNHILFTGPVVSGVSPNGIVTVTSGGNLTITDGTNTVTGVNHILFAPELVVGGTTPNGTVTPAWATTDDIWSSATHKFIDPAGANLAIVPQTVNEVASTFNISFASGINIELPLVNGDCPCTISNPTGVYAGLSGNITILQSSNGGETVGWGSNWKFSGGTPPTLSGGANAIDVLPFYCRSTTFCVVSFVGNVE